MKTDEIRSRFLKFFEAKGHKVVSSASLIPGDDPTVLFTPAGMNQFKEYFLGIRKDFSRAASSQKCLRTGDIDRVGRTAAHHTFFEMLGNFSFGDYFKEEAIRWAWEFLTKELKIPADRLHATVFQDDDDARAIWREKVGLPENHIWAYGMDQNYWPPNVVTDGPNGPCGPCSEIFFDTGAEHGCGSADCHVNCDCRRYVEIWNLVFTQFERKPDGTLVPLPQKNIDTGAGLERLAAVLQGVRSNFDGDLFRPIVGAIADLAGEPYDAASERGARIRRIADHARACVFCIADGILPTNEGRGYVERRLIRRALRDGMQIGLAIPFLHALVPVVVRQMRAGYPELAKSEKRIADILRAEEERFKEALHVGTGKLQEAVAEMEGRGARVLPGVDAFRLYDTYGLPIDVLTDALREKGMDVDIAGFEKALEVQRAAARGANPMTGDIFAAGGWAAFAARGAATKFLGYAKDECDAKVLAIMPGHKGGKELVGEAASGDEVTVLLDKTTFYPEGGGQVGDTGRLKWKGGQARVIDTQRAGGEMILHFVTVTEGSLSTGARVTAAIDAARRAAIRRHHTATHLLHAALREVLGENATQAGSLVAPDRLRFDFHAEKPLTAEQVARIEEMVNEQVLADTPVKAAEMAAAAAREKGAMSLFGEKYGDVVRVIEVARFSCELCGGTHVSRTGEIGPVFVTGQGSVQAGVRRIEAVAGFASIRRVNREREVVRDLSALLSATPDELVKKVEDLRAASKKLAKDLEKAKTGTTALSVDDLVAKAERVSGVPVVCHEIEGGVNDLRNLLDRLKGKLAGGAAVLGGRGEDRADLLVHLSPQLVEKGLSASVIVQKAAPVMGGGGGGRPDTAQAGGKEPTKLPQAIAAAANAIREALSSSRAQGQG